MSKILAATAQIQVGQVIYSSLYSRGLGVVVAIHGEQAPETIRGSVVRMGGRASFDIVFKTGQRSDKLPECILRGVQWTVYEEVASPAEVQVYRFRAEQYAEEKACAKAAEEAAHATAVAALRVAPELAHLEQMDGQVCRSKLAVKNIRKDLKKAFPAVKFSVRSDYNSVSVRWVDGPTPAAVDSLIDRYKAGSFNGMTDSYDFSRSAFGDVFGSIQYVNSYRNCSDELQAFAIDEAFRVYADSLAQVERPSVADFRSGRLFSTYVGHVRLGITDLQGLIRAVAYNTRCEGGNMVADLD